MSEPIVRAILEQHLDEVGFLVTQRRLSVRSPQVSLRDLARHEERLLAHLDGLRLAADEALMMCGERLGEGDAGAMFAAAVLALETDNREQLTRLVAAAAATPDLRKPLQGSLGWVSARFLRGKALQWLNGQSPFERHLAVDCFVAHGVDPARALNEATSDEDSELRCRAYRAAGELGRTDLLPTLLSGLNDADNSCASAAAWSAVLLGNRSVAVDFLCSRLNDPEGPPFDDESALLVQALPGSATHRLLSDIASSSDGVSLLVRGSGISGDPRYIPWLIRQMAVGSTARAAGEAFTLVTGADITALNLGGSRPIDFEAGPSDNPDDPNVDMDPDDGSPWPNPDRVQRWWDTNGSRFQPGSRYFLGAPVSRQHCIDILKNGYQRQRIFAAHYLCLLDPGTPLFNTSAPAWRQQRLLARMA